MAKNIVAYRHPEPPTLDLLPLVNAGGEVARWLEHYWRKLRLPLEAARQLAITDDRQEFARWTGRRLNPMALGCYCYLPNASGASAELGCGEPPDMLNAESAHLRAAALAPAPAVRLQPPLPGLAPRDGDTTLETLAELTLLDGDDFASAVPRGTDYRHLIFIEPGMLPVSIEVTVAHELIHLADRVRGTPRRHRCHGYDSISVDEAAVTGHSPEFLRAQLRDETVRREAALRQIRPYRFVYVCPVCRREYPRVRRYARPVSCGRCDHHYNLAFLLEVREIPPGETYAGQGSPDDTDTEINASADETANWGEGPVAPDAGAGTGED